MNFFLHADAPPGYARARPCFHPLAVERIRGACRPGRRVARGLDAGCRTDVRCAYATTLVSIAAVLAAAVTPAHGTDVRPPRGRGGRLVVTFTERHPQNTLDAVSRPAGFDPKNREFFGDRNRDQWDYDLAKERFEVVLPRGYDPAVPHGLLVFVAPSKGRPRGWVEAVGRHKLIWVCSDSDATGRGVTVRMGLALDAAHNMKQRYNIDAGRVYVAGYSSGGQVASYLVRGFSETFRGAYCLLGYTFYGGRVGEDGLLEAGATGLPWYGPEERIKKDVRLVLVDGEGDRQCRPGTARATAEAFLLDGFERVSWMQVPRLGHWPPDAAWFEKGLAALESPPKTPPTTRPTRDASPGPGQVAQARRLLTSAKMSLDESRRRGVAPWPGARRYLRKVVEDYPTTPAAAEARELLRELGGGGAEGDRVRPPDGLDSRR